MADKTDSLYYFRFYPGRYAENTRHLRTIEEHGAFMALLVQYYVTGQPLPDDDEFLSRIAMLSLAKWRKKMRPILAPFFDIRDGKWFQLRCEKELAAIKALKIQKSEAGKQGMAKRWHRTNINPDDEGYQSDKNAITPLPGSDNTVTDPLLQKDNPPSTNHQPPREHREREAGKEAQDEAPLGQIPPMARDRFMAVAEMRGISRECADYWWNEWDGINWSDGRGGIIRNPISWLLNRARSWDTIDAQRRLAEKSAKSGGGARPDSAYALKQRIEALQAQRELCDRTTPEGRREILDFNRKIEELRGQLGGNI